jgi:hypothetical protein
MGKNAKGEELGRKGAGWPEEPCEGVATSDVLHRALMTAPHFKALQKDAVCGGSGDAWSLAIVAAMGYKNAAAAVAARGAGQKYTEKGLLEALVKAKLQFVWSEGAWREAGEDDGGEDDSQDDVGVDSISVEEQVASSARFAPKGVREQSSQYTPRSGRKPT